jgi:hypothetical protein
MCRLEDEAGCRLGPPPATPSRRPVPVSRETTSAAGSEANASRRVALAPGQPLRAPFVSRETSSAGETAPPPSDIVCVVSQSPPSLPEFTRWSSFPFDGDLRIRKLQDPVSVEPARKGEDGGDCAACSARDDAYIWVSERWRVRAMDRPSGLPVVLILESRSHLDLGDLPNLLAAELGVMTVRLERAIRSLDGVARVHVNRWGDGASHLHIWFLARPYGRLQLRGTFLSLWDDILPPIPESQWRENLALVAAWLAEFGGRALAEPPGFQWETPLSISEPVAAAPTAGGVTAEGSSVAMAEAPLEVEGHRPGTPPANSLADRAGPTPVVTADQPEDGSAQPAPVEHDLPDVVHAAQEDQAPRTASV